MNEILLIVTVVVYFSFAVLSEKAFGKAGLYCWIVVATLFMNIEVLKLVDAFGMEMALGNVLVASTFLCTDILNEKYGKKAARDGALIGCATIILSLIISQIMLAFVPNSNDWASGMLGGIFEIAPRLTLASVAVFIVVQIHDVWLYDKIKAKTGDKMLWLRNCGSTSVSQLLNVFLYSFIAFWGIYDIETIVAMSVSAYAITFVCALLDTPFMYASRKFIKAE